MAPLSRRPASTRVDKRKEIHRKMWAPGGYSVIPRFDDAKVYRIKLLRAVTPAGHSFPLRPMQDVWVSGKVANEIKEHISGAVMV